jgi:hypothetical protein
VEYDVGGTRTASVIDEVLQPLPSASQGTAVPLPPVDYFTSVPVSTRLITAALRPIDGFYVPDRESKYANVFRERVALLELPDSVPMTRIRPLLESDILKDRIRYLDPHVTK